MTTKDGFKKWVHMSRPRGTQPIRPRSKCTTKEQRHRQAPCYTRATEKVILFIDHSLSSGSCRWDIAELQNYSSICFQSARMKNKRLNNWNTWYILLVVALVVQIILYYIFTKYWE